MIKPVRYGILTGLLGIVLGIGWAFYLVVGHEGIHRTLEETAAKARQDSYVKAEGHEVSPQGHFVYARCKLRERAISE